MTNRYTNIAIPEDLVKKLDEIIKAKQWGYRSRGELAKEAIRTFLRTIQEQKKK